jgi:hypothetical protein
MTDSQDVFIMDVFIMRAHVLRFWRPHFEKYEKSGTNHAPGAALP